MRGIIAAVREAYKKWYGPFELVEEWVQTDKVWTELDHASDSGYAFLYVTYRIDRVYTYKVRLKTGRRRLIKRECVSTPISEWWDK